MEIEITPEQEKEALRRNARKGWDAVVEKHGIEKMKEWGKRGGRPKKPKDSPSE